MENIKTSLDLCKKRKREDVESDNDTDCTEKRTSLDDCVLTYDIWRLIFKYLKGRELCTASTVCRTWRDAIKKEMELKGPQYISTELMDLTSIRVKELSDELNIKPNVALCFSENLEKMIAPNIKQCICHHLPVACNVVHVDAVVSDLYMKNANAKQLPENADKAGCLFFPTEIDIDVHMYLNDLDKNPHRINRDNIHKVRKEILKRPNPCLIAFCTDDCKSKKFLEAVLDDLQSNINKPFSLIGGRTDNLLVCKNNNDNETNKCKLKSSLIIISLFKPGLKSWSIVLNRKCYKEQLILAKLNEAKERIQLQKHTAAIMFGCCARIENKEIELMSFKKVFPGVSIICAYGNQEFGVDTLIFGDSQKYKKKIYMNYSTIFSIITYS